jgi:hypothetical protein
VLRVDGDRVGLDASQLVAAVGRRDHETGP